MEMSGQLYPWGERPVTIGQEAEWAPEPVWTVTKRNIPCQPVSRIKLWSSSP